MGYGAPVEDDRGFCYRTQQGCGTRLSPYFRTEDACDAFHTFLGTRTEEINNLLSRNPDDRDWIKPGDQLSLNDIPLFITDKFAEHFEKLFYDKYGVVLVSPEGELVGEFYQMDEWCYERGTDKDFMVHSLRLTRAMRKNFDELDSTWEKELTRKREREAEEKAESAGTVESKETNADSTKEISVTKRKKISI